MFIVTDPIRARLRAEVREIMKGAHPGVRNLRIPAYLGGDGVRPGKKPRSTETLLNAVDPGRGSE